jgi:hypothetical protein
MAGPAGLQSSFSAHNKTPQLKMAASLPDGDDAISFPEALVCQQTYQNVAQSVL